MNRVTVLISLIVCIFTLSACKKKNPDIAYYNKVNEIDSIYRMADNPELAIAEYQKLYKKYYPKNQENRDEYEKYITLAEGKNIDFGGKKSLYKLIDLIAPYGNRYKKYLPLFKKYGIDSTEVKKEMADWKKGLNKTLIDSFTVAMMRDQEGRYDDTILMAKNVKKNAALLMWTFDKYGFPSIEKMGTIGNNDVFFAMPTFLTHMIESKEYYPYIKKKLLEYVKSGDCLPRDYAIMVDRENINNNKPSEYGYTLMIDIQDSAQINRNRKSIGLPSLKHSAKIVRDYKDK
ncbi:hypothetical protein [Chryseobacterium indoltheticum]|nr:hypothetical protein [Chryseobacterium indoltheticum]SUX47001.1 Uncharacterised protein [Chryseobacterium indoltheticum]